MNNQVTNIEKLILSGKKVFTTQDLAVIWQVPERPKLIGLAKYYVRQNRLTRLHKGVYAYGSDYTPLDIAQKLVPLSYVSLYTTSLMHGLTFQYYSPVFCVSLKSKKYKLGDQAYIYHRVKEPIFYNTLGIVNNGKYLMADRERTICDCLYVFPEFAFDNLRAVNKEKLLDMAKLYNNKRVERAVNELIATMDGAHNAG